MSQASVPDQSEGTPSNLVALAGNEGQTVDTGDPVADWYRVGLHDSYPEPALEWRGPVAFARAHGAVPGIDHDFGIGWGPTATSESAFVLEVGADTGLLYVYDPTWDEYAVIGTDVPLAAVETAFARALQFGEHAAVEDFVALLPNVSAVRPSPGPEL